MPTLMAMLVLVTATQRVASPEDWVRKEVARPTPIFELEGVRFEYTLARPMTKKRAKDDQAKDGTSPEFPGMSVRKHTLWELGPKRWRVAIDFPGLPAGFRQSDDACEDGALSWLATPTYLTATRTEWGFPEGMSARQALFDFESWANLFLSGGLSTTSRLRGSVESVTQAGGDRYRTIVLVQTPRGDVRFRYDFQWDETRARGFVRRREVLSSFDSAFVGAATTFADWKPAGLDDLWMAGRVEEEMGRGRERWIVVPGLVTRPSVEEITAVLKPPLPGERDAYRGEATIENFSDFRTNKPVFFGAGLQPQTLPQLPGMDPTAKAMAWGVGVFGAILIGAMYVRRRMSAPRHS